MATYAEKVKAAAEAHGGPFQFLPPNPRSEVAKALVRSKDQGLVLIYAGPMWHLTSIPHVTARRAKGEGFSI